MGRFSKLSIFSNRNGNSRVAPFLGIYELGGPRSRFWASDSANPIHLAFLDEPCQIWHIVNKVRLGKCRNAQ